MTVKLNVFIGENFKCKLTIKSKGVSDKNKVCLNCLFCETLCFDNTNFILGNPFDCVGTA